MYTYIYKYKYMYTYISIHATIARGCLHLWRADVACFFPSYCAARPTAAALCCREPSRTRGGGSTATRVPCRCEHG